MACSYCPDCTLAASSEAPCLPPATGPASSLSDLGGQVNVTVNMSVVHTQAPALLSWHSAFFAYWFGVLEKVGHPSLRDRWEAQAVLPHLLLIAMETAGGRDGRRQLRQGCGCPLPSSVSN